MVKARVLIVEDEVVIARELKMTLERFSYSVSDIAFTGAEAVEIAGETLPDVIMMDINLPGNMDGIEAAKIIQKNYNIPVIYLTAHSDRHIVEQAKNTMPLAYIVKPIRSKELYSVLEVALSRNEFEKKLKRSEAWCRNVVNNVQEYIYFIEYEDGKRSSMFHSPRCREITGYRANEYEENPGLWFEIVHDEDRGKLRLFILNLKKGDGKDSIEHRINCKDGTVKWVNNICTMQRDRDDRLISVTGFISDITGRKEREEKFQKEKEQAEIANRVKSNILANLSHELRTPMNSILGYCQLLSMQEKGALNESQLEYLGNIKESSDYLLDLLNEVMDISTKKSESFDIRKKYMDLNTVLTRLSSFVGAQVRMKGLAMDFEVSPDLGMIEADEVRFQQIVYNLLSNAIKYTPSGENIGLKAFGCADKVIIKVWDTGIGIPDEMFEKIFEPFMQIENRMGQKNEGVGLGLAISKELVELHGGTIRVESGPEKGSVFTVVLPGRVAISEQVKNTIEHISTMNK